MAASRTVIWRDGRIAAIGPADAIVIPDEDGIYHGLSDPVARTERDRGRTFVRALKDAGARMLVGTDAGFGWIVPGYSIHDELAHFVAAGLTPTETLRAATADAARSAGREAEFGGIVVGARADLVLVARNPLTDLTALREPSGVMVRGTWLSRGTLARMLDDIRRGYGG